MLLMCEVEMFQPSHCDEQFLNVFDGLAVWYATILGAFDEEQDRGSMHILRKGCLIRM